MKIIVYILLLTSFLAWCEDDQAVRDELARACRSSLLSSYSCQVKDAELLNDMKASSCDYFRLAASDGTAFNKLVFKDKDGREVLVCLNNRRGCYAKANGRWAKISEILFLHYFEELAGRIPDGDAGASEFTRREITQKGKKYIEITVEMKISLHESKYLNDELPILGQQDEMKNPYFARRPQRRVYLIGYYDHFIYSKRCYNYNKKCFYHRQPENIDFNVKLTEQDFEPDGRIKDDYDLFVAGFLNECYFNPPAAPKSSFNSYSFWSSRFLSMLSYFFGGIGLVALAFVVYLRRKQ